jgi:lysozyme family protein
VQIRPSASVVNGRRYVKNFDTFFDKLIKHEGGFTDGERYPGNQFGDGYDNKGSTNLGVTVRGWAEWTGNPR